VTPAPTERAAREHYSYAHYADPGVADGFDDLRFGGPIGRYLLESQAAWLGQVLRPAPGLRILDVGTGTGRAAIGLAAAGASVVGLDFSREMLRVGADRARTAGMPVTFGVADAHHLPIAARSVDAAVCLRLLMHAIDWRACVAELCRVARTRVVVDFPARASAAALESAARRIASRAGRPVEAYRVIGEGDMRDAFAAHGFRVVVVHRQFVLPIALHKAIGRVGFTRSVETMLKTVGLLRLFGSPVAMVAER
jgi:ubiquinone/menaquinone biosynthesis C-methylase UbiE